ncbi:MAG: hypothetical protein C0600_06600 [Ignavibacteria bacterium]|nr:MAG: hypothetical protein C0600_06600 [Ignavibacteria bacterium]
MTSVFVIAQSAVTAEHIQHVLSVSKDLEIVRISLGEDGYLNHLQRSKADIVAIDSSRGESETDRITQEIMHTHPLPVVILASAGLHNGVSQSIHALEAGALTVLQLPDNTHEEQSRRAAADVCKSLRLMSEVKVVRRWESTLFESIAKAGNNDEHEEECKNAIEIVVIGASAGGTNALQVVFDTLPADFPVPILVVQHIAAGYVDGLVRWLSEQCALPVVLAESGIIPQPGCIYLAPDNHHLTVDRKRCILLTNEESVNGFRPAIARLFSSVHDVYGAHTAAVLLSGMGNDGAAEMRQLYDAGACTIAQDKETSLIHGIPGEAIKLAATRHILPVQEIGKKLDVLTRISPSDTMRDETGSTENL